MATEDAKVGQAFAVHVAGTSVRLGGFATGPLRKDFSKHEFALSGLPEDLASVLADYDVDGDGTVTVKELAAGAELLRKQTRKNKNFKKIICALMVLLLAQLAGNFGLVWSIVVANQQTKVTSNNPVMTVKGTDTPVQVSSGDFAVQSDGTMAARSGGSTTMADVLNSRATTSSAGRRRLLLNCANGTINNQNCQDDSYVTQWQTALKLTVSPTTCYFRTWEFKRASGACLNWYAPGKNFRNIMGMTAYPGHTVEASFPIASSTFTYDMYSFLTAQEQATYAADGTLLSTDWSPPQFNVFCSIATLNLVPSALGSGSISIYTTCLPPDAGICPDGTVTSCAVNYVDYTQFVPGTVTNPCFSTPGPVVSGSVDLPTGTTGCHEYFTLLAGTSQSADTQNTDVYGAVDLTDFGVMPSVNTPAASPLVPSPPAVPAGGRRRLSKADSTTTNNQNPVTSL